MINLTFQLSGESAISRQQLQAQDPEAEIPTHWFGRISHLIIDLPDQPRKFASLNETDKIFCFTDGPDPDLQKITFTQTPEEQFVNEFKCTVAGDKSIQYAAEAIQTMKLALCILDFRAGPTTLLYQEGAKMVKGFKQNIRVVKIDLQTDGKGYTDEIDLCCRIDPTKLLFQFEPIRE
ncbi:MAG: hypothetical protein S4CHLAM81_10360 [Chlamydiales bacterium]|nr:hypothetical protein [Chlamydiales bacterium]MCH9635814.1 hypothetical protein [Chlamydiales bacterium]MCH9703941.1 hypothetical protein [Chlamydiota bacterium]